jgi:FkbM family methyltransferase
MSVGESGRGSAPPDVSEPGVLIWRHSGDLAAREEARERESGWLPECLRKEGFGPATVVDVGAGMGTPPLYRAFPEAYHVLIEPLEECRTNLTRCLTKYDGEHIAVAVGDQEGTVEIHVDPDGYWNSSILERAWHEPGQSAKLRDRQVPVRTLDGLLEERAWQPPFGLKLDTEGYEARVIAGAETMLSMTQFVIAEVWVGKQFRQGSATFAEFVSLMDSRGFALMDILDGTKIAMNQGVVVIDALFARA